MTEPTQVVYLEPPETARFVAVYSTSAARYLSYSSTSSLLLNSFDQVLKNHILLTGGPTLQALDIPTASQDQ